MVVVRVHAFQALYSAMVEIEGLTVVTGPSDIGKSSLVRAIEAALFHKGGEGFVSHGELCAEVSLIGKGESPFSIIWRKGQKEKGQRTVSVNEYVVNGALLEKVGRSQPPEVAELGFRVVDYEGLKLPLQIRRQRGVSVTGRTYAPFVLGFSSTEAEKVLSRIVRSDLFTIASRNASKDMNRERQKLGSLDEELQVAVARLIPYKPVKEIREASETLRGSFDSLDQKVKHLGEVEELEEELSRRKINVDLLSVPEEPVIGVFDQVVLLVQEMVKRDLVPDLLELPSEPDKEVLEIAAMATEISARMSVPDLVELPKTPITDLESISYLADRLRQEEEEAQDLEDSMNLIEGELSSVVLELSKFKSCPLCDSILEHAHA